MYTVLALGIKYASVIVVYIFILSIMRLVYLDITDSKRREKTGGSGRAYLKLINLRRDLSFKMHESYTIGEEVYIGRSSACKICVADPHLSKKHAHIYLRDGVYYVVDLDSTNGSYLNGRKLRDLPVPIKDCDKLSFGDISFMFVENP